MEFCRPHMHEKQLKPHLQCGTDPRMIREYPTMIRPHTRPSRTNPIYIAGTILQLQITMEFCRPHMHEKHLKPHLQCGTDPRMIRPHTRPSRTSHRRGRSSTFGDGLCMEKHRVSCICYLSKTHFVRDFLQNSIGHSSTSTTCNPIYIAGTISLTNSFPNELFLCSFFD